MDTPFSSKYLADFQKLDGWISRNTLHLYHLINLKQKQSNLKGDLLEIGVYRGKSLLALSYLADPIEKVIGIDNFSYELIKTPEEQRREKFLEYETELKSRLYEYSDKDIHLQISDSSLSFPIGNYRLIHIDGDHSYKGCYSDLINSTESLIAGGIIIVDDFLNPKCLGVTESIIDVIKQNILYPLFYFDNKIYLVNYSDRVWFEHYTFRCPYKTSIGNRLLCVPDVGDIQAELEASINGR